jgi:hypothetical protein
VTGAARRLTPDLGTINRKETCRDHYRMHEPAGVALDDSIKVAERFRDEFRVGAAERDREREFPYEQCAAFRESGLLGLMVPPRARGLRGAPSSS